MVRRLNLKEDSGVGTSPTKNYERYMEEILDNLSNDLYNAVSDVMFKYRYFDIPRETLDDIISKNMERFYDER